MSAPSIIEGIRDELVVARRREERLHEQLIALYGPRFAFLRMGRIDRVSWELTQTRRAIQMMEHILEG